MADMQLEQIINAAIDDSDISLSDIPSIDLYMDQIITLIQEKYALNKRFPEDKLLTKTMINNYSKERIIKPVKGKKYSREHIVQMLMIYTLKNTLTIPEIKSVFDGVYSKDGFDSESLLHCYEEFVEEKRNMRGICSEMVTSIIEKRKINTAENQDLLIALLEVTALSTYLKNIAQGIIDNYFPVSSGKNDKKHGASGALK